MSLPSRQLSRVHGDTFALGKKFRVVAPTVKEATQNSEAVYALLKVYGEPGNPYAPIESYLRPNDEIRCTGFKNFNGQTWVMFLCDESKAGVYLADAPREPYWAWAPQDLLGKRWLMCLDARTLADAVAVEPGSLVPPSEVLSTSQGVLQEYDGDNLYAKILRGDIASYKVLETDYALAMLYEFPEAPFHVVLVPKAPSMGADDLDKAQAAGVFKELPRLMAAVRRASGAAGVRATTEAGPPCGLPKRWVPHTQIHIVPVHDEASGPEGGPTATAGVKAGGKAKVGTALGDDEAAQMIEALQREYRRLQNRARNKDGEGDPPRF